MINLEFIEKYLRLTYDDLRRKILIFLQNWAPARWWRWRRWWGAGELTTNRSSQWLYPSQVTAAATHCPLLQVNMSDPLQLLYTETHILPSFSSVKPTSSGQLHSTPSPLGVQTCEHPPLLLSQALLPNRCTLCMLDSQQQIANYTKNYYNKN